MKIQYMKFTALILLLLLLPALLGGGILPPAAEETFSGAAVPTTSAAATTAATAPPSTTLLPTTLPVTTVLPTTLPVTSVPVITVPATTVAPTVAAPTTVPPTTAPPATVPPTTAAPTVPATTAPPVTVPTGPQLKAEKAFVYHCGSGEYSYIKGDLNGTTYPASITKLMSIYVGLMYLQPEQTVTVGNIVTTVPADSSLAHLSPGDTLTVKDLMAALLLPSGNDAAQVWAVEAGRAIAKDAALAEADAKARFVAEMNRQVPLLGLTHSQFVTPDGYDANGHYSSMADLCRLAQLCLEDPLMREIMGMAEYTVTLASRGPITWHNTNLLLLPGWVGYYRPNAIGLKTGNTGAAGNCVLTAFQMDDEIVIIGVFRSTSYTDRFDDALTLYDEYA